MEKCFYVESEQYSKANFEKALRFATNLLKNDSDIVRIVILVDIKTQYQLIQPTFNEKEIKQGGLSLNGVVFKFDTIKTYSPSYGDKRDIVIIVGISPSKIQKIEYECEIKYFIYVPWNMNECISWLRSHKATEITSQKVLESKYVIDPIVKKAIDWLKNTSFPNEGFNHPFDEDRLKSVSNALNEMNIPIQAEPIIIYCNENEISYEAAYKMIDYFQRAKNTHFRTRNSFTTDFFREIWRED